MKIQKNWTKWTSSNKMKFKEEKDKVLKKTQTIVHVEKERIIKKVWKIFIGLLKINMLNSKA